MTRTQYWTVTLLAALSLLALAARNNDEDVRAMLKRQGIHDTVNAPGAAATAPVQTSVPQVRK